MKRHIPNILTICNLICGALAVITAYHSDYTNTLILIILSAVFDFLDGAMARLLKAYSPMGKELDSLADVISFGFVPSMIAYSLLKQNMGDSYAFVGLMIVAFSALRLAKFNIDERQTTSFIGLPTPANAIFWAGLSFSYSDFFSKNVYITLVLVAVMSYMLVCELPMFSLKFKNLRFGDNKLQYTIILLSILFVVLLQWEAIPVIIVCYIIISIVRAVIGRGRF